MVEGVASLPVVEEVAQRPSRDHAALIACGAIAQPAAQVIAERGLDVDVHPLPPLLHNQPQLIAGEVEALATRLRSSYDVVAVGYADCGTYGALDGVCERLGLRRLEGLHCYDLYAGASRIGLDRWPALREEYFRHYTRLVWLAQDETPALRSAAEDIAGRLGLPLTVVPTGLGGLERAIVSLVGA